MQPTKVVAKSKADAQCATESAAGCVSEVRPRPDDPSCVVCGAQMVPESFKCLSCGSTTKCVAHAEPKGAGGMCESSRTCPVANCPLNKPLKRSADESAEEYRERIERA